MDRPIKHAQAMAQKKRLKKAVNDVLKAADFKNKGQSWFLDGDDSIAVLNLQKSDFDEKYYVNFGVWLKSLGAVDFPAEHQCHIQARVTSMFSQDAEMIDRACRVDVDDQDLSLFAEFLERKLVPFSKDCLKSGTLRSKMEGGEFKKALIFKTAMDSLNLS